MPVPLDRTPDMGVSEGKTIGEVHIQPVPPETPKSAPNPRKARKQQKANPQAQAQEQAQAQPLAGSSTDAAEELNWTWRSLTESSASRVSPVFTKDGSYFITATGPAVKIYSVKTGQVVSTLSPVGTSSRPTTPTSYGDHVSAMALNPHNPFQLYTGSLDGCVRLWDILDANLLQTVEFDSPIMQLAVHEKFAGEVFLAVSRKTKHVNANGNYTAEDNAMVLSASLTPTPATAQSPVQKSSFIKKIGKVRSPLGLAVSPSGSWVVVLGGHKSYVAKTADLKAGFTKFVSPDKLMCLAFHPSEEYFATGDAKGIVRLWYCLNDSFPTGVKGVEKRAPTTTFHWHAHPVSSIAFSSNGAYLLSGGEEAVLVIWQLHTGKKEFVPRVGAPIANITVSKTAEEQYLLGLTDASFVFVRSSTFKISKVISRVKLDPAISYDRSTITSVPLAVHSKSASIILPSSHPSTLQTYAPLTSKLVSELEVSPSNRVSRREESPLEPCRVDSTAVSEDGEWLATVDGRQGSDGIGGEVYLKIWNWDRKTNSWMLNTRVDRPHGLKKVSSLNFRSRGGHNSAESFVTTGEDGTIKVWGVRSNKSETFWVTRSTTRFRSEIPTYASWSSDGSLLVVSLGPYVVLYDPSTMLPINTLTCPECPTVLSVHFVGRGDRYIAIQGHSELILWDIITESVRWQYYSTSGLSRIFPTHGEDSFLVFEAYAQARTRVLKFGVDSKTPISSHSLPFKLFNVAPCPAHWLLTNDASSFAFVGVTGSWAAILFGDQIRPSEEDATGPRSLPSVEAVTKSTLFQDLFGKIALLDPTQSKPAAVSAVQTGSSWKGKEVEKIFETPAYLLPPLASLFDPLINEFLTLRSATEASAGEDDNASEDEDAEMAEEGSQAPILVGNRLERIVNDTEMVSMIELFSQNVTNPPTRAFPLPRPYVNGHGGPYAKTNGVTPSTPSTPQMNGKKKRKQPNGNPPATAAAALPPQTTASPAAKTGQKRKKSLG